MYNKEVISKAAEHIAVAIKSNNYKGDVTSNIRFENASEDEAINTLAWCMLTGRQVKLEETTRGRYNIHGE